ncbi:MAG: hypothetical protein QXY86_01060 [Candidatus Micrarchaeaceae archaeon]
MRIQTSLEFMILLGVVASVALFAIGTYARTILPQYKQFGTVAYANASNNTLVLSAPQQKPGLAVQFPYYTEIYKTAYVGAVFYNCSNGTVKLSASSTSLFFPVNGTEVSLKGLGTASLPFVPMRTGANSAKLSYLIACRGTTYNGTENLSTYTNGVGNVSGYSPYFAEITGRKELINYSLSGKSPIIYTTESTKCTKTDWNYNPLPIQYQCGTTSAWEYRVFSIYCYYNVGGTTTTTTCIYPHDTQYNTSGIGNITYSYNFILKISTPIGVIESNISSARAESALKLGNKTVGYANVVSVAYLGQQLSGGFLINGSKISLANESAYAEYVQAEENLYSVLNYYNKTLSYSQQIDQAIYEYNTSSENLINSKQQNNGCLSNENMVSCTPEQPFSYVINAHILNVAGISNETLQYSGSIINITD